MIIPQQYLPVNWTDGMKVNKEHFIATENFTIDHLRDASSIGISSINFGLLPPLKGSGAQLSNYEVTKTATNQIQIRVTHCQAITPGGVRISIVSGEGINQDAIMEVIDLEGNGETNMLDGHEERFYVILVVNPFARMPSGNPDPEEIPIRQPFVQPAYSLQLVHTNNVNLDQLGGYHLVIGQIVRNGTDYSKDKYFIPPCSTVTSSELLMHYYQSAGKALEDLQHLSLQIIGKINYKNQKSEIAQNIKAMGQMLLNFTAEHYFYFRNMAHQQPPVMLIRAISMLASHTYTLLQILPEKEKEALLNYFFEWSDISPVLLLKKLTAVIEINYSHYQVGSHLKAADELLNALVLIWQKLNTLEYIGQHKENIVVKEEVVAQAVKERRGWNILD